MENLYGYLQITGACFIASCHISMSRPSVCPSATLMDCDHILQQKMETGTWQDRPDEYGKCFGLRRRASNGLHVALSQPSVCTEAPVHNFYWPDYLFALSVGLPINKCPKQFGKRPHRHPRSGGCTRPLRALAAGERRAALTADERMGRM